MLQHVQHSNCVTDTSVAYSALAGTTDIPVHRVPHGTGRLSLGVAGKSLSPGAPSRPRKRWLGQPWHSWEPTPGQDKEEKTDGLYLISVCSAKGRRL